MSDRIIAVCGFSRSGTSLTMQMLHKGGIEPFCDNFQSYEHPFAVQLPDNYKWLENCKGKAVKILEPHQFVLPKRHAYDFIWLDRNSTQQAKSMRKFMGALGVARMGDRDVCRLAASIDRDRPNVVAMLRGYRDSRLLRVRFEAMIRKPTAIANALNHFLGGELDEAAMASCVVERGTDCLPGLLELTPTPKPAPAAHLE